MFGAGGTGRHTGAPRRNEEIGGGMSRTVDDRKTEGNLTRACKGCGEVFEVAYDLQRFCRPSCRRAHLHTADRQPRLPLGDHEDLFAVPFEEDRK